MEMLTCIWNVLLKLFHLDLQAQTLTINLKVVCLHWKTQESEVINGLTAGLVKSD